MKTRTRSRTAIIVTTKWMRLSDSSKTSSYASSRYLYNIAKIAKGAAAASHKQPNGRKCIWPNHGTGTLNDGTFRMSETSPPAAKTAAPIPNSFAGDLGQPMFLALLSGTCAGVVFASGKTGRSGTSGSPPTYDQMTLPMNTPSPSSVIQKSKLLGTSDFVCGNTTCSAPTIRSAKLPKACHNPT